MSDPGPLPRFVAWALGTLYDLGRKEGPGPRASGFGTVRRVLVVRTDDRVGNALLTIPLAQALQKALPETRVELLLAARRAQVAEGLVPLVRFEKTDAFKHPLRFLRWLFSLRAQYDVVIDAAHWHAFSLTSALLSRWASRGAVIGPDRPSTRLYTAVAPLPAEGVPEVEAKLLLAKPLGLQLARLPMQTALGRGDPGFALPPRFIALNPGARKADHRWSDFAALAPRLPLPTVSLWGPGELELAKIANAMVAPATNLQQLAAVFRRAAVVITNDTGPMHLAVACGAPVVALFLDESGLRWASPGPRFRAVVRPTVETVLAAVRELLDLQSAPAEPAART